MYSSSSRRRHYRAARLHLTTPGESFSAGSAKRRVVKRQQSSVEQSSNSEVPSTPPHSCDHLELRRSALAAAKAGNYAGAIALFDQILQQNPESATDYNNRGLVHFQNKQHDKAIADYNMAISLDDQLDSVYNNRANYHAHHGDLLGAILDYDMAIELNPCNVRAWINQGITFRDLKMYDRAIECFDSALQFTSLEEHIYVERGRTYHLRGDWNCAVSDYQRAKEYFYDRNDCLDRRAIRLLANVEEWLDELLSPLLSSQSSD